MLKTRILAAAFLAAGLIVAPAHAANADTPDLQDRIDQVLAEYGGQQISANEVAWDGGAVVLSLASASGVSPMSVGSCATGTYCVYSGLLSGDKMAFSSCGTYSVAALGAPVQSVANARTSGVVRVYNNTGSLGSVSPNGSITTSGWGITKVGC